MPNPRLASLRAARHTTAGLKVLFGQMGSTQHPRGRVLRAYRNARRGVQSAFRETMPQVALHEVLQGFRWEMSAVVSGLLVSARVLGKSQADAEREAWELPESTAFLYTPGLKVERDAWLALIDAQITAAQASPTPEYVLGGATQLGVLQPAPVIKAGAHWLAGVAAGAWISGVLRATEADGRGWEWYKQAVPVFDERTTDCCLRVAGQAVPTDKKFHLTGTPRYADFQDWHPFHGFCRTSCVLVPRQFAEDDLTQRLREDAQKQILIRHNAKVEARGIIDELIALSTPGDSVRRKGDTREIKKLRKRLLGLRQLAGYELGG